MGNAAPLHSSSPPRQPYRPRRQRRRGVLIVYTAVILTVLLTFIGLAADTALVFLTQHQLQNAADAAALAGAEEVAFNTTQAVTNASNAAGDNIAAGGSVQLNSATDIQVGNYTRSTATFLANTAPYNACKVTAKRTKDSLGGPLNLIFGPIVGVKTSNVSCSAIAMVDNGTAGYGLLVLSPSASGAVLLSGSVNINVSNGGVMVDSSSSTAIVWSGSPTITAPSLAIAGNDTAVKSGKIYPSGTALLNQPVVPDPLASLAPPDKPSNTGTGTNPGYYPSGFNLSSGTTTLQSGIYYIDGGITLSGSAVLNAAAGCLIYLHTGGISMSGSSSIVYAPMSTGTYAGISVYQDRSNSTAVAMSGSSNLPSSGILYFPKSTFAYSGTANCLATQLICYSLVESGSGTQININYNSSLNPPSHTAFLVR